MVLLSVLFFLLLLRLVPGVYRRPPSYPFRIINAHEHFESIDNVPKFLEAMKRNDVVRTVILGSPEATLFSGRQGFYGEDKNNLEVLKIASTYPDHFIAFPTINPHDPEKLEKLKGYLRRGAKGLKLYSGHTVLHDMPLDDPTMLPVYEFCEKNQIPVLIHVNAGYYQSEFESVLQKFPKLEVICPHFCLSTIKWDRFEYLMDHYPHLYTDISFGHINLLREALVRISRNREKYRDLVLKYQDRIFFGTDMVVTSAPDKTADWLSRITRAYRDLLEKESYSFFAIEGFTLRGLHLERGVLEKIYRKNFERFLKTKP